MGKKMDSKNLDTAVFGGGCFWCLEAIFQRVEGVYEVTSGYAGGTQKDPTYEEVCSGATNHAEVCRVVFDSTKVRFEDLLEIFWKTHDPTTLNRQGNDVGTQYRSIILYTSGRQKELAEYYKNRINEEKIYKDPVVTEIMALEEFFPAEKYHQDYYNRNTFQGYCRFVITPKVEKFEKLFKERAKKN